MTQSTKNFFARIQFGVCHSGEIVVMSRSRYFCKITHHTHFVFLDKRISVNFFAFFPAQTKHTSRFNKSFVSRGNISYILFRIIA